MAYVWVALGSALGGMSRHAANVWAEKVIGLGFPWGTLIVNIAGSFVIGAIAALAGSHISNEVRLFAAVGFCGGFTTFSAFSLQTLNLIEAGQWAAVALNVAGSVGACLFAVWAGYALMDLFVK